MRFLFIVAITLSIAACDQPNNPPEPQAATPAATAPVPEAADVVVAPVTADAEAPAANDTDYLDDRSSAKALITSYFNAINRKEYARAWSYWTQGSDVQPYGKFKEGFANTKETQVTFGRASSEGAAGSLYTQQRIALSVSNEDGTHEYFAGCYTTHLSQPAVQDQVPFKPMGIREAKVTAVDTDAAAQALLTQPCTQP